MSVVDKTIYELSVNTDKNSYYHGVKNEGFSFFKNSIFMTFLFCVGVRLPVSMWTWIQLPSEARDFGSPGAGLTDSCETPDVDAKNKPRVL